MNTKRTHSATVGSNKPRQQPEIKFGPFAGGISVAIWLNSVDTDGGTKHFRSVTIAPRRYQDRETGEWKNSGNFNPSDLPALVYALQKAQEYVFTTPLPSQELDAPSNSNDSIPF